MGVPSGKLPQLDDDLDEDLYGEQESGLDCVLVFNWVFKLSALMSVLVCFIRFRFLYRLIFYNMMYNMVSGQNVWWNLHLIIVLLQHNIKAKCA